MRIEAQRPLPHGRGSVQCGRPGRRGAALLTVLWLSAALGAIAFSLANTVRAETERTTAALDGARAYYLATGAIERALAYFEWSAAWRNPDGTPRYAWGPSARFEFPTGEALVEAIPEAAKLNLNTAPVEEIHRLLLALGVDPELARGIALAILDWRTVPPENAPTAFDRHYLALVPSFRASHASFQEIEEVLLVQGMTPEIFYGTYERDGEGRLVPRGGLRDCLTVIQGADQVDVNAAPPPVLSGVGFPPDGVALIVQARRTQPIRSTAELRPFGPAQAIARLRIGGGTVFTFRATARLRREGGALSDHRRSVAALVKLFGSESAQPVHVLRWYDNVWLP